MRRASFALVAAVLTFQASAAINVRDFGAVGDGVADDTAAIQRSADELKRVQPYAAQCATRFFNAGIEWPFPAIVFPKGTYRVTSPVVFETAAMLLGEGGATICNASPECDTFYCRKAYRLVVRNLTFDGGRDQLRQWTFNQDRAYMHVTDCVFRRASGTALVSDSFKHYRGEGKDRRNPSCESVTVTRGDDGRFAIERRAESEMTPYNNSTLIIVENCRFEDNQTALYLYSDGVSIRECVFSAPADASREQLRLGSGGRLGVEIYMMGCAINYLNGVRPGTTAIRYDGGRTFYENMRVKSNGDLAFIRSNSHFNEYGSPSTVNILNVSLDTGNGPVVSLEGDNFPNRVSVRNLNASGNCQKKMMAFDREPTEASVDDGLEHAQTIRCIPAEACFAFAFTGVPKNVDCSLPAALCRYRREFPSQEWERPLPLVRASKLFRGLPESPRFAATEDFGRLRQHKPGDETAEVEALLDQARKAGGGVVELPPKWLRVSHPLILPPNTRVTCRGRSALWMASGDEPIFILPDGADAVLENLLLVNGRNAVRAEGSSGRLRILSCMLSDQKEASIYAHGETPASLRIDVSGGQASYVPLLYEGNADCSIDRFWFQEAPNHPKGVDEKSYRSIVNEPGGKLVLREVLGVPCYFLQYDKNQMYMKPETMSRIGDLRWVDNYGTLLSLNTRYGGEWGGLTPIYHFGKAVTWLEGGVTEIGCCYLRAGKAPVVADSPAADVTMLDVASGIVREPFQAVFRDAAGFHVLNGARSSLNFNYSPYAPVWIAGLESGARMVIVAEYVRKGKGTPRLEVMNGSVRKVTLNGREIRLHKSFDCTNGRRDVWMLPSENEKDSLVIEATSPVLGQVICGQHALAVTGVGGDFRPVGSRQVLENRCVLETRR